MKDARSFFRESTLSRRMIRSALPVVKLMPAGSLAFLAASWTSMRWMQSHMARTPHRKFVAGVRKLALDGMPPLVRPQFDGRLREPATDDLAGDSFGDVAGIAVADVHRVRLGDVPQLRHERVRVRGQRFQIELERD